MTQSKVKNGFNVLHKQYTRYMYEIKYLLLGIRQKKVTWNWNNVN